MFWLSSYSQNMIVNSNFCTFILPQTCQDWVGAISNGTILGWFSQLDSSRNGFGSGWLAHECQDPWALAPNPSNARPGFNPMPAPKAGLGIAQLTLKSGGNGSIIYPRAFISQQLQSPLLAGETYCVEFYTRPFKWSIALSKNIGVYFTTDSLDYYAYQQNIIPQLEATQIISDTSVWTRVKGSFVATGNEHFINIGNFRSDSATTLVPSNFPIDPWFVFNIPTYLVDAVMLYQCSDTLYTATLPIDTLLCPNDQLVLQPLLDGFKLEDTTTTYLWSTGSTDSTITVTQPGTYWVQTTINQRFVAGDTIVVDYFPANYQLNLPDTVTFCEGEQASILATRDPMKLTAYMWSTGDTLTGIKTSFAGLYWLNAQTPCYNLSDSTWAVQDFCQSYLWIPNAFTPDGDGTNDFFAFQGAPEPVKLSVYDRWGKQIYYNDNYQNNWDGTFQGAYLPAGAYTYLIEYLYINPDANQANPNGSERQVRGVVNLLR